MRHLRVLATGLAATAVLSCGGGDLVLPSEGEPATLNILQGDGQSGRVGEALPQPLVVEVLDGADRPVPGALVVVELSGATAEPDTVSTDGDGQGSAAITLGSEVGPTSGTLRVIAPESPATVEADFTVIAVPASANGIVAVSGDDQAGQVGTTLPAPLVIQVTDAFGNPIEGASITWTAVGGGSVSAATTTTDAEGLSSVSRTLGPTSGQQATLATSEGLAGSPVTFNHTVTAGSASGVRIVSGDGQSGPPGTVLPGDLVVQVVDPSGNPVVDAAVTWVVTAGGGSVSPPTSRTDANGGASTKWTLGPSAGANTVLAVVSGVGEAAFSATATAGPPQTIRKVAGDNQTGPAGAQLPAGLVVQVVDKDNNPISGVAVSWTVAGGGGSVSPAQSTTGADGRASTAWTLGPSAGAQAVDASVTGAGSVRFAATATVSNAAPTAVNDGYTTSEDQPLSVNAAQGVLANDTDPNNDALTAIQVSAPANGSLTLNANGSFTYTPNANFNGSDSFTYRANDGQANSATAGTVTITVTPVNDPPGFTSGGNVTTSSTTSSITGFESAWATGITPGPANESSQTVSFEVTTNNDAAFIAGPQVNSAGTLTFRPLLTASTVEVTVTINALDSGGARSPQQTFTITINP